LYLYNTFKHNQKQLIMTQANMLAATLQKEVIIHWWNCGRKTLDFKGTLEGCLKDKGITFEPKTSGDGLPSGYIFKIPLSNGITFDSHSDFETAAFIVLKIHLVYLGDKAQIKAFGRDQKINWR